MVGGIYLVGPCFRWIDEEEVLSINRRREGDYDQLKKRDGCYQLSQEPVVVHRVLSDAVVEERRELRSARNDNRLLMASPGHCMDDNTFIKALILLAMIAKLEDCRIGPKTRGQNHS